MVLYKKDEIFQIFSQPTKLLKPSVLRLYVLVEFVFRFKLSTLWLVWMHNITLDLAMCWKASVLEEQLISTTFNSVLNDSSYFLWHSGFIGLLGIIGLPALITKTKSSITCCGKETVNVKWIGYLAVKINHRLTSIKRHSPCYYPEVWSIQQQTISLHNAKRLHVDHEILIPCIIWFIIQVVFGSQQTW